MKILLTNDDGYKAKGLETLARIMKKYGQVSVIAPKTHQSGMGMAVSLGLKRIAYKSLGEIEGAMWSYLDATPASCVKYALNFPFLEQKPTVVVSGINHGSNASTGACYSGTLGAAQEAAINDVPSIGVSLCTMRPDADFSAVEKFFPSIFEALMAHLPERKGIFYNVNFPDIPADEIKGIKVGRMGKGKWIKEFRAWDSERVHQSDFPSEFLTQETLPALEDGEDAFIMVGEYVDSPENTAESDSHILSEGYISIVAHNLDSTDLEETARLHSLGIDRKW